MKIRQVQIITIFVACILTQTANGQKTQTMLQKENLKGKVKSVYVTSEGNYIKVWFDKTGKITMKEYYYGTDITVYDDYVYDKTGRIMSFSVHIAGKPDEKTGLAYKYHNDGTQELNGKTYQYDERGNCILETRHGSDKSKYIERIYNEKNQLVEAFMHYGPERMNIWQIDSDGRGYEETEWTEPQKRMHVFFEYNKHGDVSLITLKTDRNGYDLLNEKGVITYKRHDAAGNWLEKTLTDADPYNNEAYGAGDYFEIYETYLGGLHITRTIEYYK